MQRKHNPTLVPVANELRHNMTKEERRLWYDFLSHYPIRFYRQKILYRFIADFYCAKANLVIELDGSQHYEEDAMIKDEERTAFLESHGIKVVRIPNNAIRENFNGVCMYIGQLVKESIKEIEEKTEA